MNIKFKIIEYGSRDYKAAVALREEILRKPLGLTFRPNELAKEKNHVQIVGLRGKKVVATAVLAPKGKTCKVQRVAVEKDLQKSGVGSQLMSFCEEYAMAYGFQSIYCHARKSAVKFYLKINYIPEGKVFEEDTIPHLKMRKQLIWKITRSKAIDKNKVIKKLINFNRQKLGHATSMPPSKILNYNVKIDGEVIAGINSLVYLNTSILFINQLFVDEEYRSQRLGSILLDKVEKEAKMLGAKLAHLDTFDWQAKDFYLKHGYKIFGTLDDCPLGHKCYYMKKKL